MNIGFDAKRAFHNSTGLGNYSRTLLKGLATYYPEHQYYLFNPRKSSQYPKPQYENVHEIRPAGFILNAMSSLWRSRLVTSDLKKLHIELYHGLSHEIPVGISSTRIPSVVTIHDLIFERYPHQFSKVDVQIFRKKFRYACMHANRVIAISEQTKQDIIEKYGTSADKIDVCYQSCDPAFGKKVSEAEKERIRSKYHLPGRFFLSVGSIIERKNLLNICRALVQTKNSIPLVVIGEGGQYKTEVLAFIREKGLEGRVIFLSDHVKNDKEFQKPSTFAAIYQSASAMIYPSYFEGFGIPVLEALRSGLPVITSNVSCLPETGGDAAYYVDPDSAEEIAQAMDDIISDEVLKNEMIEKGMKHAEKFTLENCTAAVMNVYKKVSDA